MLLNEEYLKSKTPLAHSQYSNRESRILNENKIIFNKSNKYDVFLSHSYLDRSLVYTLVKLFNNAGYSVYVDWMIDTALDRNNVTALTASKLRCRMQNCDGLAYIATSNIVQSKWCPWELGYVDGNKNGRCAILPVLKNSNTQFKGQEYLGLYPYIDYAPINGKEKYEFWVNDPQDSRKYVSLKEWLTGKEPYEHKS